MGSGALKYGPVAMGFHWVIAILILTNFVLAWIFNGAEHLLIIKDVPLVGPALSAILEAIFPGQHGLQKVATEQWHKTIGITILVLSLARLVWRLTHRPPALSGHLKAWERTLAHLVHWSLYVFMIGAPLAGWILASTSRRYKILPVQFLPTAQPTDPGHFFDLPRFPGFDGMTPDQLKSAKEFWEMVHAQYFVWLGLLLLLLHVAGALKHQFFDKDNELARMVPGLGTPGKTGIG